MASKKVTVLKWDIVVIDNALKVSSIYVMVFGSVLPWGSRMIVSYMAVRLYQASTLSITLIWFLLGFLPVTTMFRALTVPWVPRYTVKAGRLLHQDKVSIPHSLRCCPAQASDTLMRLQLTVQLQHHARHHTLSCLHILFLETKEIFPTCQKYSNRKYNVIWRFLEVNQ